jgi:hypothetical protein
MEHADQDRLLPGRGREPECRVGLAGPGEELSHGGAEGHPIPLRRRGLEQSPIETLVVGADQEGLAQCPGRSVRPPGSRERQARKAVWTTRLSRRAWVPSSTAQSTRRTPASDGPRTRARARQRPSGSPVEARRANRSTSEVTPSANLSSRPRGKWAWPNWSRPRARRASEAVEWIVAGETGRSGHRARDHWA